MPPRSVVLNVFTSAKGIGKDDGVQETVTELHVNRNPFSRSAEDLVKDDMLRRNEERKDSAVDVLTCAICTRTSTPTGTPLLRCSRCQSAFYCSQPCQKSDWKSHKKSCSSSSRPSSTPSTPGPASPMPFPQTMAVSESFPTHPTNQMDCEADAIVAQSTGLQGDVSMSADVEMRHTVPSV